MITRLLLSDGSFVYPNFLSDEERQALSTKLGSENLTMQCGCRTDSALLYGISKDLRIYPLHNGYEHAKWCSRAVTEERTSSFVYDDEGKATCFLTFNPRNFSVPKTAEEVDEEEEGYVNETDDFTTALPAGKKKKKDILPRSNLRKMILIINRDTYTERVISSKAAVLSEDYFTSAVLARCKKIYPNGASTSLRAMSLETDHVSFIYGKVENCEESAVYIRGSSGSSYRRFVPAPTMQAAQQKFFSAYGCSVEECMKQNSVYVSGFAYKKLSKTGNVYTCFGRLCFFVVTRNGIFAETLLEKDVLEAIFWGAKKCGGVFLFPDSESDPCFGILRITKQGKEGKIYLNKKPKSDEVALCLTEAPTEQQIREFAEKLCF